MIEESNGNNLINVITTSNTTIMAASPSNDDLSQSLSLSEYADADESMSAPTEFLAEFLSAVMLKDYRKALKYCKLILDFEPNNITAKEFYPLILEKLKFLSQKSSSESDDNYVNASSPSPELDDPGVITGSGGGGGGGGGDGGGIGDGHHFLGCSDTDTDNSNGEHSLNESESYCSSSDEYDDNEKDKFNNTKNSTNSSSENTTHSYSSSLLEEEDDDLQQLPNIHKIALSSSTCLSDLNNGNYKLTSCSDSESPTEPLTQQITAILQGTTVNK